MFCGPALIDIILMHSVRECVKNSKYCCRTFDKNVLTSLRELFFMPSFIED